MVFGGQWDQTGSRASGAPHTQHDSSGVGTHHRRKHAATGKHSFIHSFSHVYVQDGLKRKEELSSVLFPEARVNC